MKNDTNNAQTAMKIIANKVIEQSRQLWLTKENKQTIAQPANHVSRRRFVLRSLQGTAGVAVAMMGSAALLGSQPACAQPGKSAQRSVVVAQIVDMSAAHQDVAKDFLIGSRAAWQDINSRGGIKGRTVSHQTMEIDGSPAGLRAAWDAVRNNPDCAAIFGTAADPLATQLDALMRDDGSAITHVAPWLQNSSLALSRNTFSAFSSRQEQIVHAFKSLSNMGLKTLAVVFASPLEQTQNLQDVERIAKTLGLALELQPVHTDLRAAGQRINAASAAVILFIGGTPELAQFTQGLERQARQRYVVALADVNLQTLQQMGAGKSIPVIVTQAVPLVTSSMPVVRQYREVLAKLYDEPPTPLSLAGFISARYTFEVMNKMDVGLSRTSVLDAFNRQRDIDIGGFRVTHVDNRRSSTFVTQSMLTQDGRVVG